MSYKVIGVNSGLGVSLYPFKENVICNVEIRGIFHTPGNEQWKTNFGEIPLMKKVESLFELPKADVVISSPDCGSGSILRYSRAKKLGDHKNNLSLGMFFAYIRKFEPKFFYFENLEGLFKSFPKDRWVGLLSNYRLIEHIAPVSRWGNSQIHRKRLVVIGIRRDLPKKLDKYFKLPHYTTQKTCGDLYGDLDTDQNPDFGHVREDLNELTTIYAGKKLTNREIMDHWNRYPGKKRWSVTDRKFSNAPGVYRNRKHDYPATARKANRQYDHNGVMLTPRQLARIQGVPDEFKIVIDPNRKKYWINKGRTTVTKTPPMEISVWFKNKLDKTLKKQLWHK